jgi:hypothetical protein
VNRLVAPSVPAERVDVGLGRGGRDERELDGKVAERPDGRREVGLPVVVGGVVRELGWCALGTEVVGVRADSVVAVVRARDDHREQLALGA